MNILDRLAKSKFRSRFKLRAKELEYIKDKGPDRIRSHAFIFIRDRVAPAEPVNQCLYCGKPDFYIINNGTHDIKIKFNKKRKFCHTYICNDVNQSNPEAHEKDCHYGIWIRKKKSLIERMSQTTREKAIKIFLDFCEKQLKENLKIKYLVQYDENQKYKKLTDITNCPEEDVFFNINHILPIKHK